MLQWLTLFLLWNCANCNRYQAADAIQHAIFGDDSGTIAESEDEDSATASDSAGDGSQQRVYAATNSPNAAADIQHMQQNMLAYRSGRPVIVMANLPSRRRTTVPAYLQPAYYGGHPGYYGGHPGHFGGPPGHYGGPPGHYGGHHGAPGGHHGSPYVTRGANRHYNPPTVTPFRQGQKWSGKSYSFLELSRMNVKSAPSQQGTFYRPRTFESVPVVEPCQAVKCHLSMTVIMDSSGSVGAENYRKELGFVKTLLQILAVKAEDVNLKVCVGLISYSTNVHVEIDPCCENSICRIVDQFSERRRLLYRGGSTNTAGALKVARQMLQGPASFKKVALLITDGKSNTGGSPVNFARRMREQDGIQIVALGVTNSVNEFEMKGVSGNDLVTKIDQFDEFHELANLLLQANKVASNQNFDFMCYQDKSVYKDTCERVITEE